MKPAMASCDRALALVNQELGRFLLGRAADLADHDYRLGGVVGEEQLQNLDEVGALTGSPPMPTALV